MGQPEIYQRLSTDLNLEPSYIEKIRERVQKQTQYAMDELRRDEYAAAAAENADEDDEDMELSSAEDRAALHYFEKGEYARGD